ncbi:hypothetical protein KXW28_003548 [Aspergillus fumigatus]|nr:hypothetical protein KXX30_003458 [Aspergillus fumigatus]KAH1475615.1 hypothetical protein KXX26_003807 [Aspergillus fumigatus]KAH1769656.1 hypothetical protein KXX07_004341 [Aspergillus fumigatus]KAH1835292.1 hypothetical protein KXX43_003811 [Aspergillus fumigatus]KAH1839348.1 hypothetical protein KXX54_003105 [Aspergillus fumigatus]
MSAENQGGKMVKTGFAEKSRIRGLVELRSRFFNSGRSLSGPGSVEIRTNRVEWSSVNALKQSNYYDYHVIYVVTDRSIEHLYQPLSASTTIIHITSMAPSSHRFLFGGDQRWSLTYWTSSDDRVRGGSSYSTLTILPNNTVQFHGHLDITTLGRAGFASQRTTDDISWDLSDADGLELDVAGSDGKVYTLVVKDRLLPTRADGREQSTISWEYDFQTVERAIVRVRWEDLRASYRGRKVDAEPLDLRNVKRISIMVRSFFGRQEGDFLLDVASIAAFCGDR